MAINFMFIIQTEHGVNCMNKGDKNMKKLLAFTLTELLLALTIVGVLAVLTVPILMNNIHNRMFAAQVKNMAATIEQLAQDQLITHRTRDLWDTDFGDTNKLLTNKHFSISKICNTSTDAKLNCWKTTATGNDKLTYKNLNKNNLDLQYIYRTAILKNGIMISYKELGTAFPTAKAAGAVGVINIDVNGNEKPNIGGRDIFLFFIDKKGHIKDISLEATNEYTLSQKITKCKSNYQWCYGALADNGWKMDY